MAIAFYFFLLGSLFYQILKLPVFCRYFLVFVQEKDCTFISSGSRKPVAGMMSLMKIAGLAILALAILALPACSSRQKSENKTVLINRNNSVFTLKKIQEDVRAKYPAVKQISTASLASMLTEPEKILLLDVREPQEYAVSHLPGAIQIEPLNTFNQTSFHPSEATAKSKTVILYCSVGVRSSRMAEQLQLDLKRKGAVDVYNLDGGIFAWRNEDRILVNNSGPTQFVHPFDEKYKQLLCRQKLARFQP